MKVSGELGRLIHGVMLVRGMSVDDLHNRSGLSDQTIYNILKGLRRLPSQRTLESLSGALGIPLEHLWQAALTDQRPTDATTNSIVRVEEGVWLSWTRGLAHLMDGMSREEQERLRKAIADFVQLQMLMKKQDGTDSKAGEDEDEGEPEIVAADAATSRPV